MASSSPDIDRPQWPAQAAMALFAACAGICLGVASALLHRSGFSLVGIQSLAIGAVLGILLAGAVSMARARRRPWAAIAIACVFAITAQHAWLYKAAMASRAKEVNEKRMAEFFRPGWSEQSPLDYFQAETKAEPWRLALWLADACLLSLAAVIIVKWSAPTGERGP